MKTVKLSKEEGDIRKFFEANNVSVNDKLSFGKNESVDGTGENPSVLKGEADRISKYILKKFEYDGPLKIIDIGTGKGYLVKALLENSIDAYGIEGFLPLAKKTVVEQKRICSIDMAKVRFDFESSYKCANLTTSFEVLEHIHRSYEDEFLRNLAWLADYHLCSVHMFKWPGVNKDHCNIKHECCWFELFRKNNIQYEVIGHRTGKKNPIAKEFRGTPGSEPGPSLGGSEEFRNETNTHHWEESMFLILDMRGYKF